MRCWLKKSSVRKMSLTEAAWLAGFLDGEGSISNFLGGRDYQYQTWRLSAPNTNRKSLEQCKRITGTGGISVKYEATKRRKKLWQWQVGAQRNMKEILLQVLPYLVIKKKKAEKFLKQFREVA